MTAKGIKFAFNNAVEQISQDGDVFSVKTAQGNTFQADMVFDTTGRVPNTDDMNLASIGVETNRGGVVVNDHMQTTVAHIYASGDVVAKTTPRLTPTATFESLYIADVLLGQTTAAIAYPAVPSVTFTLPRMAQLGYQLLKQLIRMSIMSTILTLRNWGCLPAIMTRKPK